MKDKQESLKSFFKERGLTQEKVADMLGVSQAYINALLTGSKQFGKKQAKRFEELFGLSETWLLTGQGEPLKWKRNKKRSQSPKTRASS